MGDLFLQARTQMPKDKPGSLKSNEYADVVSFVLKANEFPAGQAELKDESTGPFFSEEVHTHEN